MAPAEFGPTTPAGEWPQTYALQNTRRLLPAWVDLHSSISYVVMRTLRAVFLNRLAAARYLALPSIIPDRERLSCNLSFYFS